MPERQEERARDTGKRPPRKKVRDKEIKPHFLVAKTTSQHKEHTAPPTLPRPTHGTQTTQTSHLLASPFQYTKPLITPYDNKPKERCKQGRKKRTGHLGVVGLC